MSTATVELTGGCYCPHYSEQCPNITTLSPPSSSTGSTSTVSTQAHSTGWSSVATSAYSLFPSIILASPSATSMPTANPPTIPSNPINGTSPQSSTAGIGTSSKHKTNIAVIASSTLGGLMVLSLIIALIRYRRRQQVSSRVAPSAEVSSASHPFPIYYCTLIYVVLVLRTQARSCPCFAIQHYEDTSPSR
jgi:hypothetical protein